MKNQKQRERVLEYLQTYASINPLESWRKLGVYRLAAVIHVLRKEGFDIETRKVTVKNQFDEDCTVAEYFYND